MRKRALYVSGSGKSAGGRKWSVRRQEVECIITISQITTPKSSAGKRISGQRFGVKRFAVSGSAAAVRRKADQIT